MLLTDIYSSCRCLCLCLCLYLCLCRTTLSMSPFPSPSLFLYLTHTFSVSVTFFAPVYRSFADTYLTTGLGARARLALGGRKVEADEELFIFDQRCSASMRSSCSFCVRHDSFICDMTRFSCTLFCMHFSYSCCV